MLPVSVPPGTSISATIFGAIRNAVALQDTHDAVFFIADLHAITERYTPALLASHTLTTAAVYLACGVDPVRTTLFVQSQVPAHSQLARLLGAVTSVGALKRMIQYKEKSSKQGGDASLALLDYPVLMAADILLYQADLVPVGDDQRQHLELTRELAVRLNREFAGNSGPLLKVPDALILPEGARLMSLTDGTRKMSKSDPDDNSRINLMDSPDVIRAKIKRAKTDSIRGLEFGNPARPEAHNLLTIYQLLSGRSKEEVAAQCTSMGYGEFKPLLTEAIISVLSPIQERYRRILQDEDELQVVLKTGRERAESIANETLKRVSKAMGFLV